MSPLEKKEEAKFAITNNGRCHAGTVTNLLSSRLTLELTDAREVSA